VLVRRIVLTLAAFAAVGAAVPPALGLIGEHSAPLSQAPFSRDGSTAPVADAGVGRAWTAVAVAAGD
jgi:hypothetical protein